MKSQVKHAAVQVGSQILPVTFRRFRRHFTAVAPGQPRLLIRLQDDGSFACHAQNGKKFIVNINQANRAFAKGVERFWN